MRRRRDRKASSDPAGMPASETPPEQPAGQENATGWQQPRTSAGTPAASYWTPGRPVAGHSASTPSGGSAPQDNQASQPENPAEGYFGQRHGAPYGYDQEQRSDPYGQGYGGQQAHGSDTPQYDYLREQLYGAQQGSASRRSEPSQPRYGGQAGPVQPGSGGPSQPGYVPPPRERPSRRRTITIVAIVAVMVAAIIAAGGSYFLLRTKGSPQETAQAYLSAWQRGDYGTMTKVSVGAPRGGVGGPLTAANTQLGVRSTTLKLGTISTDSGTALANFTVTDVLTANHTWVYHGKLRLVTRDRRWWVNWSPSAIYPGLRAGDRFTLSTSWPSRAQILSANGTVLSSPATLAESGSLGLLTGVVGPATAEQAKKLGAPYQAGDPIGQSGIEAAYQNRLAGSAALTIKITNAAKHTSRTVRSFAAVKGKPVRTSIEMRVQLAASHAVSGASTSKPVDMVVIQPSTGKVLAVVERPGGYNRALEGTFPPGSTFKIVTASALARGGMTPSSQVQCPSKVVIDGARFHNDKNEQLGATDLLHAFAISCNTTFAELATQRLSGKSLASMARAYGFNTKPALGISASLGSFELPKDQAALAADAFGQGTDLVSPLSQASVVAAVQSGTWRPPILVTDPAPQQNARPHAINPRILSTLRPMMNAVVRIGTAAGVGFPTDVYGKTGTAEYEDQNHKLRSHGWFIGYRGNLAFAVIVEGGGFGASSAGPIANTFLHLAP
ncbi:MAG TPA: penicillin-binding transpeptidase domain-containing protein [Streptosporangiaceae bacterium]|nr:penicillin-binding transpeptidase domain-containing protein [Streptosporangiaceae bacterium]